MKSVAILFIVVKLYVCNDLCKNISTVNDKDYYGKMFDLSDDDLSYTVVERRILELKQCIDICCQKADQSCHGVLYRKRMCYMIKCLNKASCRAMGSTKHRRKINSYAVIVALPGDKMKKTNVVTQIEHQKKLNDFTKISEKFDRLCYNKTGSYARRCPKDEKCLQKQSKVEENIRYCQCIKNYMRKFGDGGHCVLASLNQGLLSNKVTIDFTKASTFDRPCTKGVADSCPKFEVCTIKEKAQRRRWGSCRCIAGYERIIINGGACAKSEVKHTVVAINRNQIDGETLPLSTKSKLAKFSETVAPYINQVYPRHKNHVFLPIDDFIIIEAHSKNYCFKKPHKFHWIRSVNSPAAGYFKVTNMTKTLHIYGLVQGAYEIQVNEICGQEASRSSGLITIVVKDPYNANMLELQTSESLKQAKSLVEMVITANISLLNQSQKVGIEKELLLLLEKSDNKYMHVNVLSVQPIVVMPDQIHVVFNALMNDGSKGNASSMVSILRKHLHSHEDIYDYKVTHLDTSICTNECNYHGKCHPITKQCHCDLFWVQSFSFSRFRKPSCDWFIPLVIALSALVFLIFWFCVIFIRKLCYAMNVCHKDHQNRRAPLKYAMLHSSDDYDEDYAKRS